MCWLQTGSRDGTEHYSYVSSNIAPGLPLTVAHPSLPAPCHDLQTSAPGVSAAASASHPSGPNGAPALESPRIEITSYLGLHHSGSQFFHDVEVEDVLPSSKRPPSTATLNLPSLEAYRDPSCLSPASSLSSRSCNSEASSYESSFSYPYASPQTSPWQSPCVSPKTTDPEEGFPRGLGACSLLGSPRHSPSTSPRTSITEESWLGARTSRPPSPCNKRKHGLNGRQLSCSPHHSPTPSPHSSPRVSVTDDTWLGNTTQYTSSAIVAAINALSTDGSLDLGDGVPVKARKTALDHSPSVALKVEPAGEDLGTTPPTSDFPPEEFSSFQHIRKGAFCDQYLSVPQHPYPWARPRSPTSYARAGVFRARLGPHTPATHLGRLGPGPYELRIEVQPKSHHRAHYETEGSRGAVKASAGGHPSVQETELQVEAAEGFVHSVFRLLSWVSTSPAITWAELALCPALCAASRCPVPIPRAEPRARRCWRRWWFDGKPSGPKEPPSERRSDPKPDPGPPCPLHGLTLHGAAGPSVSTRVGAGHTGNRLHGYVDSEPLTLQLFIGTADDRLLRPHAFYQVHRITGKTVSTTSHEAIISNTKVLEIPLLPENNMRAIIDCAGILKLRNSDIELRKGETDIGRKNTRVRLVFRVHIPQPSGRTLSLQVASNPIECSQRSAQELPLVEKQSAASCPVLGGKRMVLSGHNFLQDSKVIFVEKAPDGHHIWEMEAKTDGDLCKPNSLVVEIPPFRNQRITSPVQVSFYVCNGKRKRSQYQHFTYLPANGREGQMQKRPAQQTPHAPAPAGLLGLLVLAGRSLRLPCKAGNSRLGRFLAAVFVAAPRQSTEQTGPSSPPPPGAQEPACLQPCSPTRPSAMGHQQHPLPKVPRSEPAAARPLLPPEVREDSNHSLAPIPVTVKREPQELDQLDLDDGTMTALKSCSRHEKAASKHAVNQKRKRDPVSCVAMQARTVRVDPCVHPPWRRPFLTFLVSVKEELLPPALQVEWGRVPLSGPTESAGVLAVVMGATARLALHRLVPSREGDVGCGGCGHSAALWMAGPPVTGPEDEKETPSGESKGSD
ncbi:hypothetical protein CB1_000831015 [Camelus ferus]|nr:hypothetical protein CB1_000831015 [Camelus ferus]